MATSQLQIPAIVIFTLVVVIIIPPSSSVFHTKHTCVDSNAPDSFHIECSSGDIDVKSAFYGFSDDVNKACCANCAPSSDDCKKSADFSGCNGISKCRVEVKPFGDGECKGRNYAAKYLSIKYQCVHRTQDGELTESALRRFFILEGLSLSLSCASFKHRSDFPIWSVSSSAVMSGESTSSSNDVIAQGNHTFKSYNDLFSIRFDHNEYILRTNHVTSRHAGTYSCKRINSTGDTETIFFQVFVYARPTCHLTKTKVELESSLNATCATRVWSPKIPSTWTNEHRREIETLLPGRVEMRQFGERIEKRRMENTLTSWGPLIDVSATTTMRTMNLTATKVINPLDNQTQFACYLSPRGYEWDAGGPNRTSVSQPLLVVKPESWKRDVMIGITMAFLIAVLFLILLALLAYKGLLCPRHRRRFVVALKLHRQNGGLYMNCPDETAPHEIDAVANYQARIPNGVATKVPGVVSINTGVKPPNGHVGNGAHNGVADTSVTRLSPCPHCHQAAETDVLLYSPGQSESFINQSEAERLTLERERGPSDTMDIQPPSGKMTESDNDAVVAIKRALAHTGAIPKTRPSTVKNGEVGAPRLVNGVSPHHRQQPNVTNLARDQKMARDCRECQQKALRLGSKPQMEKVITTTTTTSPATMKLTEMKTITTKDRKGNSIVNPSQLSEARSDKPLVRIHSIRGKVERASMRKKSMV